MHVIERKIFDSLPCFKITYCGFIVIRRCREKMRHIEFVYSFIFICVNNNRGIVYMRSRCTRWNFKWQKLSERSCRTACKHTHTHAHPCNERNGQDKVKWSRKCQRKRTFRATYSIMGLLWLVRSLCCCYVFACWKQRKEKECLQKSQNIQMTNEMWMVT